MNAMKDDMNRLQELVVDAARQAGILTVLADSDMAPEKLQRTLELASGQFECSALEVRKLCEKHSPGMGGYGSRPVLPRMETAGFVERFGYGWLHIAARKAPKLPLRRHRRKGGFGAGRNRGNKGKEGIRA